MPKKSVTIPVQVEVLLKITCGEVVIFKYPEPGHAINDNWYEAKGATTWDEAAEMMKKHKQKDA